MKLLVAAGFCLFVISLVYAGSNLLFGNRSSTKHDNDVHRNNGHEKEQGQKCGYEVKQIISYILYTKKKWNRL